MTTSTGAAPARSREPQTKTIDEMRLEQRSVTEELLRSMEQQYRILNERIEIVRQLLVDQGAALEPTATEVISNSVTASGETIIDSADPITTDVFRERAVAFLTVNGPSPAATIGRECGASANSATVRMQGLRDKGLVRQNRKTKRWSLR